ncbi:50S ribosomal protein L25/general stress protein Ctc [Thioalkalivibrio denitrificans]|uniref:Large ribosomal subunit protein bL25 n=1 Tax=Thioalkalivibrio denitrificans TaxID=108003 RepID=A0A1V3NDZ1_9GAMM|nr:50S ribosomal protein L25/general stress protein Ctc [Thioalkalivibrio denitrificans]OOG23297.1 50S ribosomal protein L25/general stress protein Ctc [Thioalkalivibrio denitrificans]
MSLSFELQAEPRADQGKGASRRLRRIGKVPAILYGAGKEPQSITLDHNAVKLSLEHEAFYSHILSVQLEGRTEKAILRDVQRHPAKPVILHLDLLRVSEDQAIRVHVPLHFINEETCVGVKTGGGMVSHQMVEVEVECLPKDLPEFISVDVAKLNVGDSLHLSEIALPDGVTIVALSHGPDHDLPVVSVLKPRGTALEEEGEGGEAAEGGEEEEAS